MNLTLRHKIPVVVGTAVLLAGAGGAVAFAVSGHGQTSTEVGNTLPIDDNHQVDDRGRHVKPGDDNGGAVTRDARTEPGDDRRGADATPTSSPAGSVDDRSGSHSGPGSDDSDDSGSSGSGGDDGSGHDAGDDSGSGGHGSDD